LKNLISRGRISKAQGDRSPRCGQVEDNLIHHTGDSQDKSIEPKEDSDVADYFSAMRCKDTEERQLSSEIKLLNSKLDTSDHEPLPLPFHSARRLPLSVLSRLCSSHSLASHLPTPQSVIKWRSATR